MNFIYLSANLFVKFFSFVFLLTVPDTYKAHRALSLPSSRVNSIHFHVCNGFGSFAVFDATPKYYYMHVMWHNPVTIHAERNAKSLSTWMAFDQTNMKKTDTRYSSNGIECRSNARNLICSSPSDFSPFDLCETHNVRCKRRSSAGSEFIILGGCASEKKFSAWKKRKENLRLIYHADVRWRWCKWKQRAERSTQSFKASLASLTR